MRYPAPLDRVLRMPDVEVLHHGIDVDRVAKAAHPDGVRAEFGLPPEAPLVGTVANFRAEKALDQLIEAADIVRRAMPDVRFLLVGQGATEGKLRSIVRDRHLEETVVFTGHRADAPRLMAALDVFAQSSLHEGLSIALIEAMSLRRPVVVTDVGGQAEVVQDGAQGLVVPPGEPSRIAESVLTLLRDDGLRSRMGEAAHARALTFDIRRSVARTQQVYEELLS
jgi:glycosyltransferase involved in cell wall biosynthesis